MCPLNSQKDKPISYQDYLKNSIQQSEENLKKCEEGSERYFIICSYINYCKSIIRKRLVKKYGINRANDDLCSSDDFDDFIDNV